MANQESEPLERIHILPYKSDLDIIRTHYGKQPGTGPAIRAILRQFTKRLASRLQEVSAARTSAEIELEISELEE